MIRVTDLKKKFGDRILFENVNFTIGKHEKVGLIGRNGAGKSTLLKMILGQIDCDQGKIEFFSKMKMRSLDQNLVFSGKTVLSQVEASLEGFDEGATWKAESILLGLGFKKDDFEKDPASLSGGFKIRLRLAEVLVSQADVLVLDEPTNYLDIISLRWLENFLKQWKGCFVLVTHDREFMEKVVSHTMIIRRGVIKKYEGGPVKVLNQVLKDEEIYEKTRKNMQKKREKTEEFIRKFRAGARSAGLVQSRIKSLAKQDMGESLVRIADVQFNFKGTRPAGNYIYNAQDVSFGYKDDDLLFKDFGIHFKFEDRIGIVGKNGKGKSTLLNVLAQYLQPVAGEVVGTKGVEVGYFGSRSVEELDMRNSILKELGDMPGVTEQDVRKVCSALLFKGDDVHKKISVLSGGEKSRVCLAKVMLKGCNLLFLDEPTNHLDMESCLALSDSLRMFEGCVVVVAHDEKMLSEVVNRLVVFDGSANGCNLYNFGYEKFLKTVGWGDEIMFGTSLKVGSADKGREYNKKKENKKLQRKLMKDIEKLEAKKIKIEKELGDACLERNVERIRKLGEELKTLENQIDDRYNEFDTVMG